jgi:hypothetical protein
LAVRSNNGNQRANWVLDGFHEKTDTKSERALELWQGEVRALFAAIIIKRGEWERLPGRACNLSGNLRRDMQTQNHYFRHSEIDYSEQQLGSYYDGSSDVEGFLKEIKRVIGI